MFLNKKIHILSKAILLNAIINLLTQAVNVLVRVIFNSSSNEQDMLNSVVWTTQIISHVVMIIITVLIFYLSIRKLKKYENIEDQNDAEEFGYIQRKYIPDSISDISINAIRQLLMIWSAIFVWAEILYAVTSAQYKNFIKNLTEMFPVETIDDAYRFADLYNSTHGFKYIGMFTAITLGVLITGIFLQDKWLYIIATGMSVLFMLAFAVFEMVVIDTSVKVFSIVWTSIIFHGVETVGMIVLAVYLAKKYKGL